MICPSGYTSLAELWREFCSANFATCYTLACDQYHREDFNASFTFGSPLDLCEQLFTKTFESDLISLASPAGQVFNLTPKLDQRNSSFFKTASTLDCAVISEDPEEVGQDAEALTRIGSSQFCPWPHRHGDVTPWRQAFKIPTPSDLAGLHRENIPYHTLPFSFERIRFVIPKTMPLWAHDTFHRDYLNVIFAAYGGSTICLADKQVRTWRTRHISGKAFLAEFLGASDDTPQKGRPSKLMETWEAYDRLFPCGHPGSWKEALAALERIYGIRCSVSTLKRATKDFRETHPKSGSKSEV